MHLFILGCISLLTYVDAASTQICNAQATCIKHGTYKVITIFHGVGVCTCNGGYSGKCCETNINECHSNPCQHGGACHDRSNGYTCTCRGGYSGTVCQTDINECGSNPCLNHGYCHNGINAYTCSCRTGFAGHRCETNINECVTRPCLNGGTCHDGVNKYTCTCQHGYSGTRCQTNINECASNPCLHGGTCLDGVNKYTCTCPHGYTGKRCETDINECATTPCHHGGTCHDGVNKYTCTCLRGYTGSTCQTNINECAKTPCLHGGTCHDGVNKYTCTCVRGYSGSSCQTNINECASRPCKHGGVCHDGVNKYTCSCASGYTGVNCETDINECGSNPCQHSGVCHDGVNIYTCSCKAGFTGVHCEKNINECASNPCQYGGTCHDGVNRYTCSCIAGFHGVHCETEIDECASQPCQNGATCVDQFNGYKCECLEGDSGKNCELGTTVPETPKINLISETTVTEGTPVVKIACFAEGIPAPVVTWEEIDAKFQPNVRQVGHFLVIENVTMADKGYYTCTAKNRVGTDIKAVNLIVASQSTRPYVAPVISAPSTVIVKYYTDARLVCNVTGYPTPSVRWEYNQGRNIPGVKMSGGVMLISNVTSEATGLYVCIATNDIGSSRANIMLEATYDSPKLLTSPLVYSGNAGISHNFTCSAAGHPVPIITWTFSSFSHHIDTLPPHKIHSNSNVIELVDMQESGVLTCTATNEFGMDTAKATVIVHHSSAVVG
ncbi:fibropellin-1-like isoform X1 [Mytilus trossulus]|uniref:fibropellin-1-like isoform X1 n=1 Tax=Mytilus trossulus TaxID=6551 RepID=UPI003005F99A